MALINCSRRLGLLMVAFVILAFDALANEGSSMAQRGSPDITNSRLYGPGDVYANIPVKDEFGRDQLAMFRMWNPDPVAYHEANLEALNPLLAKVVRKAQADNPGLRFVIGSGRRNGELQRKAVAWGWSNTRDSPHGSGNAVDLWPLDARGHVTFEPAPLNRIATAMKKAAADLGVPIRWGGHFLGFKDMDRSHFELAPH